MRAVVEMVVQVEHQALGTIPIVNRAFKYDEPMPAPAAPPVLGQHTDRILQDVLGLTVERIEELRLGGVVS